MWKGVEMLEPIRQKYMGFNFPKLRSGDVRLLEVVPWEVVRH